MKIIVIVTIIITFFGYSCFQQIKNTNKDYYDLRDFTVTDYLVKFSHDNISGIDSLYGYKDLRGNIIIQPGKYIQCFTDTFRTFAFVFDEKLTGSKFVAIDRNERILFDAYIFDNGPDYLEDGLFRIIRNGKIGYANEKGIIVIAPQFECADPFENGTARVSLNCKKTQPLNNPEHTMEKSDSWFFIDKIGNIIK
ncbi:MAG: WG repeat-containing protein [Stygiobacter sp.]